MRVSLGTLFSWEEPVKENVCFSHFYIIMEKSEEKICVSDLLPM